MGARGRQADVVVQAAQFSVLTFVRGEGSGEWDYPWDLTGGLYRYVRIRSNQMQTFVATGAVGRLPCRRSPLKLRCVVKCYSGNL